MQMCGSRAGRARIRRWARPDRGFEQPTSTSPNADRGLGVGRLLGAGARPRRRGRRRRR
jgi:hypothetical protein